MTLRVILLPGLDGTGLFCGPLAQALGASRDVQIIRFPEHLARYDDLLHWLRPDLDGMDYALVAESFSGPLALKLAALQPKGLKALILVASFARSPRLVPAIFAGLLGLLPLRSKLFAALAKLILVGSYRNNHFLGDFSHALRSVPNKVLARRLAETLRTNEVDVLPRVSVPKLALTAANDWLVSPRRTQDFRDAGWTVAIVAGPHFLTLTHPEETARIIDTFLRSCPD